MGRGEWPKHIGNNFIESDSWFYLNISIWAIFVFLAIKISAKKTFISNYPYIILTSHHYNSHQ